jgi:hypothetical protein
MSAALALIPFASPAARPERVALPDTEARAQAEGRHAIIKPILSYDGDPARYVSLRLKDGTPVTSMSRLVEHTAEANGTTSTTIYRWLRAFKDGGLPALADKQRSDKGASRFFQTYPRAAWLAAYLYLDQRQSCRVAHEAIVREREALQIPAGDLPHYDTVRAWLKSMPPSLTVYARNGRKAYRDRMAPYLRRGYTEFANQIWVGDHMIHDVECANDCFDDAEWGAPIRIRLSAMLDYRSRYLTGANWAWEGSSRAIAATMRRAVLRCGPPEHLYVDNGKDYRKVARGAQPGYLAESPLAPQGWWRAELDKVAATGFLARMGVAVTHCIPHHPQSKHVERFFRTLHERFDKVWPTYTSGNPFTRPDATTASMMEHRKLLKSGRAALSKHPLASHFVAACLAWIEEYNVTPHGGEGMEGCSPAQVFEAHLNPAQKPAPEPAALALLMAEREKRTVRECAVALNKRRFVPVDEAGYTTLHCQNEREILVAYDPGDRDAAAALDLDGCFLAWLRPEDLARFAPGDPKVQKQIGDSMAMRRRLEKGTRETIEAISRAARSNGAQTPLAAMAARLAPPSGNVTDILTQRKPRLAPSENSPQPTLLPGQAAERMAARLLRRKANVHPGQA